MRRKDFIKYLRSRSIYNQFMNNSKKDSDIKNYFGRKFLTDDDVLEYCLNDNGRISKECIAFCFVWDETREGVDFWAKHSYFV